MPAKRTKSQFLSQCESVHGDIYDYSLTSYIRDNIKIEVVCQVHGSFFVTPSNHIHRKSGCPKCSTARAARALALSEDQFKKKAKGIHGDFYDYSKVEYKNNSTKVIIICPKHGEFLQQPNAHTDQKCGCPICKSSHGETVIRRWLTERRIVFKEQYRFDDCFHKNLLIFDFYLPNLNMLIEYNGIQHYRFNPHFHKTKKIFDECKMRDEIKRKYAKDRGLRLITIPYNKNIVKMLIRMQPAILGNI